MQFEALHPHRPTAAPDRENPLQALLERFQLPGVVTTQGLRGAARAYLLRRLHDALKAPLVCIAPDEEQADRLASDLGFFFGGAGTLSTPRVLRLPGDEVLPYDELSPDSSTIADRMGALFHLQQATAFPALVVSIGALLRKVVPPGVLDELSELLGTGQEYDRDTLARKIADMGYYPSPLVEDVGTFSVRGGIIDVFSPLYSQPARIEFFGDTIESIRAFDPSTQRTTEAIPELLLSPARELILNEKTRQSGAKAIRAAAERRNIPSLRVRERLQQIDEAPHSLGLEPLLPGFFEGGLSTLFDYLKSWNKNPIFYIDDPMAVERASSELWTELERAFAQAETSGDIVLPPTDHFITRTDVRAELSNRRVLEGGGLTIGSADDSPIQFHYGTTQDLRDAILSHHGEDGALSPLIDRLARWRDTGVGTAIACGSMGQADRLKHLLLDRNVMVRIHAEPLADAGKLYESSIYAHLFAGEVSAGFVDPAGSFAVVSDEEIFGPRTRRRSRKRSSENPFESGFRDLKEGDLVVHTDFGIARYGGLRKMEVRGVPGDFLVLEYAGRDKVYLPVSRMRLIQKFTGADPTKVTLDKLGTATWEKTKKRVKEHLLKMAAELLSLYAARKAHPGFSFTPPDGYFRQFEADFEFEETEDQAKAIEDVLADMQKAEPMDRLVCGDVGYGKTEVAMRAAFKATLDKKQVAILVPTTVLAQQHYNTFRKRFSDYAITIDVVSRMRKSQDVRDALNRTKDGKVDILIGTHKLLGTEVSFKDLGLLIVDEEQRFGVKQKEQIKKLKTQLDVLTLTATPIPRTLNMSMSGLRDMSIIATPPQDRRAIRTFVIKFDQAQIREAIMREIQRGGQIFFVHNRVQSIHSMERMLKELVPEVSIGVAHGQMAEGRLERVMADFVDKKFDVLLCTSIIESGLDISSANTMIVNRADQFGLAQLYQLRGRVGRAKERAYAYLLVPAGRTVTRDAQRRLEVLQAFTELGAGFSIASHDLEIRGAGNLLGPDQSGNIAAIGFDLYTQLLDEAVHEMRGEPLPVDIEPEITLPIPALIPDDYVPDVHQRLLFYKRFSMAQTPDELSDLRAELVDRFGEAPDEVDNLSEVTLIKIDMRGLCLRALEVGPGRLVLTLGPDARLEAGRLANLIQRSKGAYRLTPDMKLVAKTITDLKGSSALIVEAKKVIVDLYKCASATH